MLVTSATSSPQQYRAAGFALPAVNISCTDSGRTYWTLMAAHACVARSTRPLFPISGETASPHLPRHETRI